MLRYVYNDITRLNNTMGLKLVNQFLGGATPRIIPKFFRKIAKPFIYQLLFSLAVAMLGAVLLVIGSGFKEQESMTLIFIGFLVLLIGAFCTVIYFKKYSFVFALKKGKLEEWIFLGMDFETINIGYNKGVTLYLVKNYNNCVSKKIKKVFVADEFVIYFKNILDSVERPKVEVLRYYSCITIPIIFALEFNAN